MRKRYLFFKWLLGSVVVYSSLVSASVKVINVPQNMYSSITLVDCYGDTYNFTTNNGSTWTNSDTTLTLQGSLTNGAMTCSAHYGGVMPTFTFVNVDNTQDDYEITKLITTGSSPQIIDYSNDLSAL